MKESYPKYKKGDLDKIYDSMSNEDKEILEEFIIKCGSTASEDKLKKIRRLIVQFYDVTELPLDKQDKKSVNNFLFLLNASGRSVWTKNEIKVYLKQFLKRKYKDLDMIEDIKTDNKRGLNPEKITENNLIVEEDVEKMIRFAKGYKEKAYLLLSFNTGARPIELINLKFKDIKFEDNHADINLFSPKTKQSRTFPVVKETMKALWEMKEHYPFPDVSNKDYVFPSRWRDKPMTSNGINKMLRRMAKASGLKKDIWGYLLRHSKCTRLYEELPTPIVEKLMGHQDQYRTYAHISSRKAREELLKKIYNVEEMPKEKQKEMEKQLEEQNKKINFLASQLARMITKGLTPEELTEPIEGEENFDSIADAMEQLKEYSK